MRLLLVEDNKRLGELLGEGLSRAGWTVDIVETLEDAQAACAATHFEAILLDRGLPDGDGVDLLGRMRGGDAVPALLVLTARGGLQDRVEGLNRGADDYIVKPVALEELVARINAAVRRTRSVRPSAVTCGRLAYDPLTRTMTLGDQPFDPPRRERVVLEALLNALPRAVTKELLEERLDSFERQIGRNAIEVYVHRLRKRLSDGAAGAAIETVRGLGYRLVAEDAPVG